MWNFYLMYKQQIKTIICGLLIGVANLIPGISGGTMAVIFNIYDDIIDALSTFMTHPDTKETLNYYFHFSQEHV